jgi:hypothetical protein
VTDPARAMPDGPPGRKPPQPNNYASDPRAGCPQSAVWGAATVANAAASGWIQRPPRTPTGGCPPRSEREAGRALFSHRDAPGRVAPIFSRPELTPPSPDPQSVQHHVSATAPRMDLSLAT